MLPPSQHASLKDACELCLTLGLILGPLVHLPLRFLAEKGQKGARPPVWDPWDPRNRTVPPVLRSFPFFLQSDASLTFSHGFQEEHEA